MRTRAASMAIGISLAWFAVSSSAQAPPRAITNSDIVRMVKAGLSEENIILAITGSALDFDSSVDALIKLKEQGVPEKVIATLLKAVQPPPGGVVVTSKPANDGSAASQMVFHRHGFSNGQSILSHGTLSQYPGGIRYTDSKSLGDHDVSCQNIQTISSHRPSPGETLFLEIMVASGPSAPYGSAWHFTNPNQNPQWAGETAARLAGHCSMKRTDQQQVAAPPPGDAPGVVTSPFINQAPAGPETAPRTDVQARIQQLEVQLKQARSKYEAEVKQLRDAQSQALLAKASCDYANNAVSRSINCFNAQLQDQSVAEHQRNVRLAEVDLQDVQSQLTALRNRQ